MPSFPLWSGDKTELRYGASLDLTYPKDVILFKRGLGIAFAIGLLLLTGASTPFLSAVIVGASIAITAYNAFRIFGARNPQRDLPTVKLAEKLERRALKAERKKARSTEHSL